LKRLLKAQPAGTCTVRDRLAGLRFVPGSRSSLSARGQFLNTFAGIGFCLASSLLAMGGYLIQQQFANPVQAQSAELLFSALLIATAATLFYCLLHPSRKRWRRVAAWHSAISWGEEGAAVARSVSRLDGNKKNLVVQNRYVDHALVRIQR
jgi:hypothetical protein